MEYKQQLVAIICYSIHDFKTFCKSNNYVGDWYIPVKNEFDCRGRRFVQVCETSSAFMNEDYVLLKQLCISKLENNETD